MLLVLGLMAFLANGDNYAAASLITSMAKDLNLTVSAAASSVTAYMLSFGAFTLLFGPLSDRFGKVKIINMAAVGTAIFSILGAFAFNLPSLIFFRAMNGLFGAGIFPVTMALMGESFDNENRQRAIGKIMGFMFLGAASATVIGGTIAYLSSWRFVYAIYGIVELILAIVMLKILKRDKPVTDKLNLFSSYGAALTNYRFMRLTTLIFFMGFTVFGCFTYSGILIQESTGLNVLLVGLMLSLFGLGTVFGGRMAPKLRLKMKKGFLVSAAILGYVSLFALSSHHHILILSLGLLGFGFSFVLLQSTLIATAQEKLPGMTGTAMSVVSFNFFLGGALGTWVNGMVMKKYGIEQIFYHTSYMMLTVGIVAGIFISRFEMRKRQGAFCVQGN